MCCLCAYVTVKNYRVKKITFWVNQRNFISFLKLFKMSRYYLSNDRQEINSNFLSKCEKEFKTIHFSWLLSCKPIFSRSNPLIFYFGVLKFSQCLFIHSLEIYLVTWTRNYDLSREIIHYVVIEWRKIFIFFLSRRTCSLKAAKINHGLMWKFVKFIVHHLFMLPYSPVLSVDHLTYHWSLDFVEVVEVSPIVDISK